MKKFKPVDLQRVRTYSIKQRKSLVERERQGSAFCRGGTFREFLETLPNILASKDFKKVVAKIAEAKKNDRVVIWGMGAHVIKVGLSPVIIDLMKNGFVTCLALNGAGVIHDVEMAMMGKTSEDVSSGLRTGSFGMGEEAASFINRAVKEGVGRGQGFGESVGNALVAADFPFLQESLLATATGLGISVTVHVAVGTDIIHMHPSCSGEATGESSHRDFRLLVDVVCNIDGGVFLNIGSAVILPEVFLKALTVARNLNGRAEDVTTVNMDFIRHYRAMTNVVQRPVSWRGNGYNLVGHHEIMIPLLAAALKEEM